MRRTFRAVEVRNYRLWLSGQGISLAGTWMQTVAQGLLVLQITGSGTALGIVTALQALPVLLLGPWGGVIADRLPKRAVLCFTQASSGVLGLLMGLLVLTGAIRLEMIYVLAMALGVLKAIDVPTRQSFVMEIVGPEVLSNAVTLNSVQVNMARVIGPTIAAVLIATVGMAWCFILDGLSYFAVLVVLLAMRVGDLHPAPRAGRQPRTVARRTPLRPGLPDSEHHPADDGPHRHLHL